jgi:hypothetical protein
MSLFPTAKKDVEKMSFDKLTLVLGESNGKKFQPMNPEATLVALKSGEVGDPSVLDKIKSLLGMASKAEKDSDEVAKDALRSANLSAMYDETWKLTSDIQAALTAAGFDDDARKDAIDEVISQHAIALAEFAANYMAVKCEEFELAKKAGARHNEQDLADVKATHEQVGKAIAALQKAHAATKRLVPDEDTPPAKPAEGKDPEAESGDGTKAGNVPSQNQEVDMTPDEVKSLVADAVKAALEVKNETKPEEAAKAVTLDDITTAVKAAVDPIKSELETAKAAQKAAEAERDEAKKALEAAVSTARNRSAAGGHETALDDNGKAKKSSEEIKAEAKGKTTQEVVLAVLHN